MRILVTGGTGFIGRPAVEVLFRRGHEVFLLRRNEGANGERNLNSVQCDLSDSPRLCELLKAIRPDAALHLAWEGLPDYGPQRSLQNIEHAMRLFPALVAAGCKCIVGAGSCWEYASTRGSVAEDAPLETQKFVALAKHYVRRIGESLAKESSLRFYWARLFFVYGPGQRELSLLPQALNRLRSGRPAELRTPENKNDFIFVEDVADALADLLERQPPRRIYNVGSGAGTRVADVIALACDELGCPELAPAPVVEQANAEKGEDFCASLARITQDLNWRTRHDLRAGLRKMIGSLRGQQ